MEHTYFPQVLPMTITIANADSADDATINQLFLFLW